MTRATIFNVLLVAFVVVGLFVLAIYAPAALAQDCEPLPKAVADIESHGGSLVDLVDVRADHIDQLLIAIVRGGEKDTLVIGGVKDGCMVTPPFRFDTVEPVTPA